MVDPYYEARIKAERDFHAYLLDAREESRYVGMVQLLQLFQKTPVLTDAELRALGPDDVRRLWHELVDQLPDNLKASVLSFEDARRRIAQTPPPRPDRTWIEPEYVIPLTRQVQYLQILLREPQSSKPDLLSLGEELLTQLRDKLECRWRAHLREKVAPLEIAQLPQEFL